VERTAAVERRRTRRLFRDLQFVMAIVELLFCLLEIDMTDDY
jgi:hypothetical protein